MNAGATLTNRARGQILCALAAFVAWNTQYADAHASGPRLDRGERAVIRAVNQVRAQHGLPRLRAQRALNRSADAHTRDMLRANFIGHASSNGRSMESRVRRYRAASTLGENLAYLPPGHRGGQAASIVRMWMNSPSHRAILLSPHFRRVGVGRRTGAVGPMRAVVYTADFASAR